MDRHSLRYGLAASLLSLCTVSAQVPGSEGLIEPTDMVLASGSGLAVAGTGLFVSQPGVIDIEIPENATVTQALLYWHGLNFSDLADDDLLVNGQTIIGRKIGGATDFFSFNGNVFKAHAFRADVTSLGLVAAGANSVAVEGLDMVDNMGASLVVTYDDGTGVSGVQAREGQDLAFSNFRTPLNTTVPVEFTFAAVNEERRAELALVVGGVDEDRPNVIRYAVDGGPQTELFDELGSNDGPRWDTVLLEVVLPAGATTLSVQVDSFDDGVRLPSALAWLAATLAVPEMTTAQTFDRLNPRFWRNNLELWAPAGIAPDDRLVDLFQTQNSSLPPWVIRRIGDRTVGDALSFRGGFGWRGAMRALLRHATAAVINASHPNVDAYPFAPEQVIDCTNAVLDCGCYFLMWGKAGFYRSINRNASLTVIR